MHGFPFSALALALFGGAAVGQEILVEAEHYDRCHETVIPSTPWAHPFASGGYLHGVRGLETGEPNWLEYDVTLPEGLYELWIRAGGNDSRQAALVSVDGGPPVTVLDDPPDALPLDTPLPPDAEERSRTLEETLREHRVGVLALGAGRHRIRVQHAGLPGRSNAFGYDWIKLVPVVRSDAPRIQAGTDPDPEGGWAAPVRGPVELHLLTSFRFWGPRERPTYLMLLWNRERATPLHGTYRVRLVPTDAQGSERELASGAFEGVEPGEVFVLPGVLEADLPVGSYWLEARVQSEGEAERVARAQLVRSEFDTPAWAKRARTVWNSFLYGTDLAAALDRARRLVDSGLNVLVNANVDDFLGEEGLSYPFRGGDEEFRAYLEGVQEAGACVLMYHTMITVSEHFYYEHKGYWGGRRPFFHCSWLSIYPDSAEWNAHQAADFRNLFRHYPLDGIFLDNACATGAPGARTPEAEEAIARHQSGLRAAIKRGNPTGILYPNYNVLTPDGLRTVARAWDAHMLEGYHPEPGTPRGAGAWTVRRFVQVASRVRELTGKPFWPLMYARDDLHPLCIAACAVSRANPCGVVNDRYLHFLADVQEYLYSDFTFPAPPGSVALLDPVTGDDSTDPDLAATALLRTYPTPPDTPAGHTPPVDWVIQVVNAAQQDGRPAERTVRLRLDLPGAELARPAWVLRPEAEQAEPLALSNPLDLTVGTWAVVVIAEEVLPRVRVSPPCPRPVPGLGDELQVSIEGWTEGPSCVEEVRWVAPAGWAEPKGVKPSARGHVSLPFRPPADARPGNHELTVALTTRGGRCLTVPLLARVRARLEVALRPDHFAANARDSGETRLCLTNHTDHRVTGRVRMEAPEGWTVTPDSAEVSLAPGEIRDIPCRVTWPTFRPDGLYDVRDVEIAMRLDGPEARAVSLPVRLHAPVTRLLYCPLGTRPRDIVRTGATPGGGFLSDIVRTVCGYPNHVDDPAQALRMALDRQRRGEQRMVVWFRTGPEAGDGLHRPEVVALMREFMALGGGVILQENVFRGSGANRFLLDTDLCPIGPPYETSDEPGGQWSFTDPQHPSVVRFVSKALEGDPSWRIPAAAQPARVSFTVKPWATVVARNEHGDPALVVSTDPSRRVAYLAGSLEGTYMDNRFGLNEYPEQMSHLLYFYAELARWLSWPKDLDP